MNLRLFSKISLQKRLLWQSFKYH